MDNKTSAGFRVSIHDFLLDLKEPPIKSVSAKGAITTPSRFLVNQPNRVHERPLSFKQVLVHDVQVVPDDVSKAGPPAPTEGLLPITNTCNANIFDSPEVIAPNPAVVRQRKQSMSEARNPPVDSDWTTTRIVRTYSKAKSKRPEIAFEKLPSDLPLSISNRSPRNDNETNATLVHDISDSLFLSQESTASAKNNHHRTRNRIVKEPPQSERQAKQSKGIVGVAIQRKRRRAPVNELALVNEIPLHVSKSKPAEVST